MFIHSIINWLNLLATFITPLTKIKISIRHWRSRNFAKKRQLYGVQGNYLKWFESHLSNRKQYIEVEEIKASYWHIKCVVLQGSVLEHYFFKFICMIHIKFLEVLNLSCFLRWDKLVIFLRKTSHNYFRLSFELKRFVTALRQIKQNISYFINPQTTITSHRCTWININKKNWLY